MILLVGVLGLILIIAAIRNSQGALFAALKTDLPDYIVWAAAIFAVGAIGYAKPLRPVSRGLLGLILVVIVLRNYNGVIKGFENAWKNPGVSQGEASTTAPKDGAEDHGGGLFDSIKGFAGDQFSDMITDKISGGGSDMFGDAFELPTTPFNLGTPV